MLLQTHGLTQAIFEAISANLAAKGLLLRQGRMVNTTIIGAPTSTKNESGTRDPEMQQTRKGNQWYFGMKAHTGADLSSGLEHTVIGTAANVNDVIVGNALLHVQETDVFADAGQQGAAERDNATGAAWHVAMSLSVRRPWKRQPRVGTLLDAVERLKVAARAKVEHPFHIIKNRFGLKRSRYRGLDKNTSKLPTLFGLATLLIAKWRLIELKARGAS